MFGSVERLSIGTLRARGVPRDDIEFRQALTRVLDSAELQPAGVPPSAVLIVRRMIEPLPGVNDLRGHGHVPWERALRSRLEALYRSAARPERGAISGDCEAVVFASRTELLACLARDLVQGVAGQQWWWQALLARWPAGLSLSRAVAALLADEPEQLPGLLAQLHSSGDSPQVLDALDAGDALALARALAAGFGLSIVTDELSRPASSLQPGGEVAPPARAPDYARGQASDRPQSKSHPHVVPGDIDEPAAPRHSREEHGDATTGSAPRVVDPMFTEVRRTRLTRERQLLLGLALALAHRPWAARAESFQREALRQWWHAVQAPDETEEMARALDRRSPAAVAAPNGRAHAPLGWPVADTGARGDAIFAIAEEEGRVSPTAVTALPARGTTGTPATAEKPARNRARSRHEHAVRKPADTVTPSREPADAPTGPALADPVTSEFAGVLYLINLMTALELPECFEDDWRLASRLGPCALLETLGRALLEAAAVDAAADPLWPWLAALDGRRPGEPLGRDLAVPRVYRLPRAWVDAGGVRSDTYYMAQAAGRLRLWSADYLLAEVPRDAQALDTQAAVELGRFEPCADRMRLRRARWRTAPLARLRLAAASPALRRFVACVLPFLRHRLAIALGEPAAGPDTIAALLRGPARLYASPTHIDLVAPLDAISLPARLAGLDRDPGWQPSLGRVVSFHFE